MLNSALGKHSWEKLLRKGLNLKSNFKLCRGGDSEKCKETWRTNTDDINARGLVEHEKLFDDTCKRFLMEKVEGRTAEHRAQLSEGAAREGRRTETEGYLPIR